MRSYNKNRNNDTNKLVTVVALCARVPIILFRDNKWILNISSWLCELVLLLDHNRHNVY